MMVTFRVLLGFALLAPACAFVSPLRSSSRAIVLSSSSARSDQHKRFFLRPEPSPPPVRSSSALSASTFFVDNSTTVSSPSSSLPTGKNRFQSTATSNTASEQECILQIDGVRYNLTEWAKAHPGGVNVLRKFHDKDASKAFHAAGHSDSAYAMLQDFDTVGTPTPVSSSPLNATTTMTTATLTTASNCPVALPSSSPRKRPRWQQKLFTREDPIGVHKYLGIFCLAHFVFRFYQMYFGDISAGLGSRLGKGPALGPALAVLPHALLSLSSLIFHTVPRERVVGKPMIWAEYRIHNIVFGVRSVICTLLAWATFYWHQAPAVRRIAVVGSCATALVANILADQATHKLRVNNAESTTATMPYWEGCSVQTQKRFKLFYAYCQFMATGACIATCNPAWGLAVLLAIQGASLMMTLVRKGLLSPKGYHIGYTTTLIMPFLIGLRSYQVAGPYFFPIMCAGSIVLFQLRRLGINKYLLWLPVYAARILIGDRIIPYDVW